MDFTPRKDWVDTNLNVANNGALISSDFKPFKIGGAPTIFAGPGTYHQTSELSSNPHRNYLQPRPRHRFKWTAFVNWLSLRR